MKMEMKDGHLTTIHYRQHRKSNSERPESVPETQPDDSRKAEQDRDTKPQATSADVRPKSFVKPSDNRGAPRGSTPVSRVPVYKKNPNKMSEPVPQSEKKKADSPGDVSEDLPREECMFDTDLWSYMRKVKSNELRNIQAEYNVSIREETNGSITTVSISDP